MFMLCQRTVFSAALDHRLGLALVSSDSRVPNPPARYLPTVGNTREERYKQYTERYIRRRVDGDCCSMVRSRSAPVASGF